VIEPPFSEAHLYDPWRHALAKLSIASSALLAEACLSLREVLPDARGTFVLGVADFERSAAMYEHGESLVWRDAGCLFATLQLTATWLGIGSCIMGIVGAKVAQLISADGRVRPVGAMAFGL
jgi:nitroreductase